MPPQRLVREESAPREKGKRPVRSSLACARALGLPASPLKKLGVILALLGVANYAAYFLIAILLGGTAARGEVREGHYFLSGGGDRTEVSAAVFRYSLLHDRSIWITQPLGIIGVVLFGAAKSEEMRRKRQAAEIRQRAP